MRRIIILVQNLRIIEVRKIFATVLILIIALNCSNWLDPEPAGDTIVVLTFDDAHISIFTIAYPLMQEFSFKGTNFVHSNAIGQTDRFSLEQWHIMEDEGGWESGGHTMSHANLTAISPEAAEAEIRGSRQYMVENGLRHDAFALPSGHANAEVMKIIKEYFENCRSSEDFKHNCPIDPFSLGYYFVNYTTSVEDIKSRILRGIVNHECMVIIGFHKFAEDKEGVTAAIRPQEFKEVLQFLRDRQLRVMTISEAISRSCD